MLLIDFILDGLFGFSLSEGSRHERQMARESYGRSAQVAAILGRGAYSVLTKHQLHNFCLLHERYVHPSYVLGKDHITLQSITPTHAFFCVSTEDVNVYDTAKNPFLWVKQFFCARKLVIMPHESLHRLAEEVGDPTSDKKLTFIR